MKLKRDICCLVGVDILLSILCFIHYLMIFCFGFYRLCSLLENHAADFGKVAVYLVAEYIAQVQTVTILPNVKVGLYIS